MENKAKIAANTLPKVQGKIDRLFDNESVMKALATITIANNFMIHGIKVIEGAKGLFVAMPNTSYESKDGQTKYNDICHAITSEMKQLIDRLVISAYKQALEVKAATAQLNNDEPYEIIDDTEEPDFVPSM